MMVAFTTIRRNEGATRLSSAWHRETDRLFLELDQHCTRMKQDLCSRELLHWEHKDLRHFHLEGLLIRNVLFDGADLSHACLNGTHFERCRFIGCTFDYAWMLKTQFLWCNLLGSSFTGVSSCWLVGREVWCEDCTDLPDELKGWAQSPLFIGPGTGHLMPPDYDTRPVPRTRLERGH